MSRDGIVTFNELVAAQQNVYNVGYDLAVVLATLGVGLDGKSICSTVHSSAKSTGDLTTGKLSLGSKDKGLAIHGKFEADASLTRNDYYTNAGGELQPVRWRSNLIYRRFQFQRYTVWVYGHRVRGKLRSRLYVEIPQTALRRLSQ